MVLESDMVLFPSSSNVLSIHGHMSAISFVYGVTNAVISLSGYCFLSKEKAGHASMKSPSLSLRITRMFLALGMV